MHVESFLVDQMQDSNNMGKVLLGVALGEDGHVEDGPIGKLDLQIVQRLLDGGH
jgi:hypothetical protein